MATTKKTNTKKMSSPTPSDAVLEAAQIPLPSDAVEVAKPTEVAKPVEEKPDDANPVEEKTDEAPKKEKKPRAKKATTKNNDVDTNVETKEDSPVEENPEGNVAAPQSNGIFGKNDIVASLHKKFPDVTLANLKKIVDTLFDDITTHVSSGNKVKIHNFGSFQRRLRQARVCNHPKDNEKKIHVPASYAVGFEVFAKFKNLVKDTPIVEEPATEK